MNDPQVQWTTAAPLWESVTDLSDEARQFFRRPALLRFASDEFMTQFASILASNPPQLQEFRAQPETWRGPGTAPAIASIERLPQRAQRIQRARLLANRPEAPAGVISYQTSSALQPLKLYQPAHQRYYLVGAGLVCKLPGQPDRHIETGQRERVTFVVRKVAPPGSASIFDNDEDTWQEYAFVGNGWLQVDDEYRLAENEEQNPLFAVNYLQADGRRRRVLAGLVPVGKREAYIGAPERSGDNQLVLDPNLPPPPEPRTLLFMSQVTEPWKRLIERAFAWRSLQNPSVTPVSQDAPLSGEALNRSRKDAREHFQTASWYVLLDLAKLLRQYIPNVWQSITNQSLSSPLTSAQLKLVDSLTTTTIDSAYAAALQQVYAGSPSSGSAVVPSNVAPSLAAALQQIQGGPPFNAAAAASLEQSLDAIVEPYDRNPASGTSDWPAFLFPLADPEQVGPLPPLLPGAADDPNPLTAALARVDGLTTLIAGALPSTGADKTPARLAAAQPVMRIDAPTYFVIRCVFERPNCGPLQPTVISPPTEPFLMAGFFDPDAPARPIRIGLPVDTTPAGLRKFDKNTAFMISDVLCGQIDRAKSLGLGDLIRTVLPFPLHKDLDLPDRGPCRDGDGLALGMICSLSIPIITICALILLMIMVNLLDIIFRWVPYFILCLPLPKFSGKPGT